MYVRNRNRGCIQGCLVLVIMLAIGGFVVSLAFSNLDEYASSNGDVEIDARSIEVPNVTGMDIDEATAELESLGLEVETVEESDFCYTAGHVSEQFPTGQAKTGSTVTLTVSTTPDMYDVYMAKNVPDVRGYTVDEAVDTLTAGGWVVDGIDGPADGIAVDFDVTDVGGRTGTLIAQ